MCLRRAAEVKLSSTLSPPLPPFFLLFPNIVSFSHVSLNSINTHFYSPDGAAVLCIHSICSARVVLSLQPNVTKKCLHASQALLHYMQDVLI